MFVLRNNSKYPLISFYLQSIPVDNVNQEQEKELNQLRIDLAALTTQCAQLDEANRAWQQYQPAQLHHLQNKLQDYLPLYDNISFEELSQMILDLIIKEREDFNQRYQMLQKTNDDLRLGEISGDVSVDCYSIVLYRISN
jgi:hypothetical protein